MQQLLRQWLRRFESGEIDFDKLPQLVDYLVNHTEGVILAGTTGESPTLTHEEELQLFQRIIELIDGRIPIIWCRYE